MSKNTESIVEAFIEKRGLSAEADGLPRIAGRMWGFFIVYGGPCSFAELAEKLQVSRGSISTNARILRDLGIIERVARPGDRQDYYQLTAEPYTRMLQGYVDRMKRIAMDAESTEIALPSHWKDSKQRLVEMRKFYDAAVTTTENLIQELEDTQ